MLALPDVADTVSVCEDVGIVAVETIVNKILLIIIIIHVIIKVVMI